MSVMSASTTSPISAAAPGSTVVRVASGRDALGAADLEQLCRATGAPVTAGPLWWRAASDAEPAWTPVLLRAERDGELVGVLPLGVRRVLGVTTVRLASAGRADHARLPAYDGAAAQVLADALVHLLATRRPWRLALDQLPADDRVIAALAARLPVRVLPGTPCPYVDLAHDVPLSAQLSKNGRSNLRNGRNRLDTDGRQARASWTVGLDALALLPEAQALRRARDHAVGRSSQLDTRAGLAFHTAVATGLAGRGKLESLRYEVDGELAGYIMLARDGEVLRVWDGRVAPGYERYGLGWLTHCEVLEHALADPGVVRLDWLLGEQENKQRSATGSADAVHVRAESARWLAEAERRVAGVRGRLLVRARSLVPPERRAAARRLLLRG